MAKICNKCDQNQTATVPYIVYESDMARAERHFKRLWGVIILLIVLLVATNALWLWHSRQYERAEFIQTVEQETDEEFNQYVGGNLWRNNEQQQRLCVMCVSTERKRRAVPTVALAE